MLPTPPHRVALWWERERLSAADILALDIPFHDKLWVLIYGPLGDESKRDEFACQVAEQAILEAKEPGDVVDPRSIAAVDGKRKFISGAIHEVDRNALTRHAGEAWSDATDGSSVARICYFAAQHDSHHAAYDAARAYVGRRDNPRGEAFLVSKLKDVLGIY